MWIEVKYLGERPSGSKDYAVELRLTDRMVRLGVFHEESPFSSELRHPVTHWRIRNVYREGDITDLDSPEDAAYAIAEYQLGAEVANMIPMHLTHDVPS